MKKIVLSFTVLATVFQLNSQVSFESQTSGTTQDFEAIDIHQITGSTYELWTSGTGGTILHSSDLGANWSPQTSGVTATLHDITFVTSTDGWACGSTGTILGTQNGGTTWGVQAQGAPATLYSAYFHSITSGIVIGMQAYAITTDGGNSWSPNMNSYSITSVDFVSTTVGFACGGSGTIYKTIDGGSTWSLLNSGITASLEDIHFISPTEGWASGYSGVILHTTDAGVNWTLQPNSLTSVVAAVKFFDDQNGWACGYSGVIYQTRDGGTTWTAHTSGYTGTTAYLRDLILISEVEGIAVGEDGIIIHFEDMTDYSGIDENETIHFALYPNPAKSELTVQTDEQIETISIFNITGELVQNETSNSFSIANLPSGIYMLQVNTGNAIQTKRFIKE